jgi:hypothetical protein
MADGLVSEAARLIDRPRDYATLAERPNFREVLDRKAHKLRRVLSGYSFQALVRCGLADCRTPHRDGFLVETDDGLETNVGHVCGRNAFGTKFDLERAAYERIRELQDLRDRAKQLQAQVTPAVRMVQDLYGSRFGVEWIESIKASLYKVVGGGLLSSLEATERRREYGVNQARRRSEEEINRLVAETRRRRKELIFETTRLGSLEPMPWLVFDFKGKLITEVVKRFQDLQFLDVDGLELPALRQRVKALDGWELRVREAEEAIGTAHRFLTSENIELLSCWIPEAHKRYRTAVGEWASSPSLQQLRLGKVFANERQQSGMPKDHR